MVPNCHGGPHAGGDASPQDVRSQHTHLRLQRSAASWLLSHRAPTPHFLAHVPQQSGHRQCHGRPPPPEQTTATRTAGVPRGLREPGPLPTSRSSKPQGKHCARPPRHVTPTPQTLQDPPLPSGAIRPRGPRVGPNWPTGRGQQAKTTVTVRGHCCWGPVGDDWETMPRAGGCQGQPREAEGQLLTDSGEEKVGTG